MKRSCIFFSICLSHWFLGLRSSLYCVTWPLSLLPCFVHFYALLYLLFRCPLTQRSLPLSLF